MPTPPKSSRAKKAAAKKRNPAAAPRSRRPPLGRPHPSGPRTGRPRHRATTRSRPRGPRAATRSPRHRRAGRRHRQQPAGRLARARRCSRTSTSARRSCTSTTSASPSGSSTPAAPAPTAAFQLYESLADITCAEVLIDTASDTPVFVRFSTVAGSRGSADTARDVRGFATKFYTARGQLGPRRQQHPGVLHPGRHQVPRHHPRGEARARPRDPAGADRPRHVLGLRVAPARVDPHADVGRCPTGPSPARTARWRASASTRSGSSTRAGKTTLVKFHWKPVAGHPLASCGRSPRSSAASTPTSTAATSGTPSRPAPSRSGTSACRSCPTTRTRPSRASTCSTRRRSSPRSCARCASSGALTLDRNPDELLRRDRAGRVLHRAPRARASTSPTTRCCRPGSSPTSTPSSPGSAARTSTSCRSTGPRAPVNDNHRDGFGQQAIHEGVRRTSPNSLGGGCPFHVGDRRASCTCPAPVDGIKVRERAAVVRRPLHARRRCSGTA